MHLLLAVAVCCVCMAPILAEPTHSDERSIMISFYQRRIVPSGHYVYVSGNISALGAWDSQRGIKLNRDGKNWFGNVSVLPSSDIEYKFFTSTDPVRHVIWDHGPNAKMTISGSYKDNSAGSIIRVMSFNIRFQNDFDGVNNWHNRKDFVARVMQENLCDFIGLQEAFLSQSRDLQHKLPEYMWYGPGRDVGGEGEAAPIFYLHEKWEIHEANTFWLSDTPEVEGSKTYGNEIPRICTWGKFKNKINNEIFYVYNFHLDHLSMTSRVKGALQIKEHMRRTCGDSTNVILMGDSNAVFLGFIEKTLEIFEEEGMKLQDSCRQFLCEGTFHWWTGLGIFRIDYIFIPQNYEVEYWRLVDSKDGRYPSDHFPIMAQFTPGKYRKSIFGSMWTA